MDGRGKRGAVPAVPCFAESQGHPLHSFGHTTHSHFIHGCSNVRRPSLLTRPLTFHSLSLSLLAANDVTVYTSRHVYTPQLSGASFKFDQRMDERHVDSGRTRTGDALPRRVVQVAGDVERTARSTATTATAAAAAHHPQQPLFVRSLRG